MKYYLIKDNNLVGVLDAESAGVVALPLFRAQESLSLMSETHVNALMTNLSLTPSQALSALGLVDLREQAIKCLVVSPQIVSLKTVINGPVYKIIDIGAYSIWQVDAAQDDLLVLHAELWAKAPAQTLGLLAVVQTFGTSFAASAVRTATGMTPAQALARRDRIAAYLESIGKINTATLRAATDENAQVNGIAVALGTTMAQVWGAMVP